MPRVVGKRPFVDAGDVKALPNDRQAGMAGEGEGEATGTEFDVGHSTVWVNGDIRYITMQVSGLEVFQGAASRIQLEGKASRITLYCYTAGIKGLSGWFLRGSY